MEQDDPFTTLRRVIGRRLGQLKDRRKVSRIDHEKRSLDARISEYSLLWERFLMTGAYRRREREEE